MNAKQTRELEQAGRQVDPLRTYILTRIQTRLGRGTWIDGCSLDLVPEMIGRGAVVRVVQVADWANTDDDGRAVSVRMLVELQADPGVRGWVDSDQVAPSHLTGSEVRRMMRLNRSTIRDLADRMGLSPVRVRMVRDRGILPAEGGFFSLDWIEAISGSGVFSTPEAEGRP